LLPFLAQGLSAQTAANLQSPEMKQLDFLLGQWKGTGYIQLGPNQRRTFTETESVQTKLGGSLVLIQGLGKARMSGSDQETVAHNALAVVSFDNQPKAFRWRAYRAEAASVQTVDTEAKVGDNRLEWGFKDMRGSIRFTIPLDKQGRWYEIGEFSAD